MTANIVCLTNNCNIGTITLKTITVIINTDNKKPVAVLTCEADFLDVLFCIASEEDGTIVVGEVDIETTDARDLNEDRQTRQQTKIQAGRTSRLALLCLKHEDKQIYEHLLTCYDATHA